MAMAEGRSTILVIHPSSTDPTSFLERISTSSSSSVLARNDNAGQPESSISGSTSTSYTSARVPWEIENKYYSASVTFQAYPQEVFEMKEAEGVEVVMYIYEGSLNSLPPALIKTMATPRDIALAIRIRPSGSEQSTGEESNNEEERERMEDLFDEIGMEYMDESSLPEDDDERPISIEERIRQTLMTHMWSNMIRKPINSRLDTGFEDDNDEDEEYNNGKEIQDQEKTSDFPITFNPSQPGILIDSRESTNPDEFPGLDELRSQIMLEDLDKLHGRDEISIRRDMMDVFDDFTEDNPNHMDWLGAEYTRLDDWLDEDEGRIVDRDQNNHQDVEYDEEQDIADLKKLQEELGEGQQLEDGIGEGIEESQFEDDFADFAPFQSAPQPVRPTSGVGEGLDPTPLLLHLQNVREELAGLDEDTRRERAGREVESVLMSLGLGGLGGVDFEDEEGDQM